jgi:hypothetical protein
MLRTVHALLSLLLSLSVAHATIDGQRLAAEAFARFSGSPAEKKSRAIDKLVQRGKPDAALVLIMELRYLSSDQPALAATLVQLTGANPGPGWADWVRWQEAHPETDVMDGFAKLKARVFDQVDPNFQVILTGRQLHSIRLEEITRGSARKDGISALTNPKLVFCVAISGDVRAYTFGRGIDELRCITASGGRAKRQLSGRSTIIAERSVSDAPVVTYPLLMTSCLRSSRTCAGCERREPVQDRYCGASTKTLKWPVVCRFLGRHAPVSRQHTWPTASEKRQGTKSREGCGVASTGSMGNGRRHGH